MNVIKKFLYCIRKSLTFKYKNLILGVWLFIQEKNYGELLLVRKKKQKYGATLVQHYITVSINIPEVTVSELQC